MREKNGIAPRSAEPSLGPEPGSQHPYRTSELQGICETCREAAIRSCPRCGRWRCPRHYQRTQLCNDCSQEMSLWMMGMSHGFPFFFCWLALTLFWTITRYVEMSSYMNWGPALLGSMILFAKLLAPVCIYQAIRLRLCRSRRPTRN